MTSGVRSGRSVAERVRDVRRVLAAAQAVFEARANFLPDLVRATGLTPEGVELGFESLERDAPEAELRRLVASAGDAPRVHVILSANVFVAPLRALALAWAAAPRVTVRPSPRDPVLVRALVEAAADPALTLLEERDPAALDLEDGGELHVYGRDRTIAEVRSRVASRAWASRVVVRGHGAGAGLAIVTRAADLDAAADALAADVAAFDQRGCLSPRVALVHGDAARGEAFARALDARLEAWGVRVPRGALSDEEHAEASLWTETLAFAGRVWRGGAHVVGLAPGGMPLAFPPAGRHVLVATEDGALRDRIAPIARFVVAVGSDEPGEIAAAVPAHARAGPLGRMQRPPLDGPVDRRGDR